MTEDWRNYLDRDERVLWAERAGTRVFAFRPIDALLVPFSLVWGGVAVFWMITATSIGAPWFFLLFGSVFVVADFFIVFGRFFLDAWARSKTAYALTNKRALILKRGSLRAQPLAGSTIEISVKSGRNGAVTFGEKAKFFGSNNIGIWTGNDGSFTFREISNPSEVYKLARSIQNGEKQRYSR